MVSSSAAVHRARSLPKDGAEYRRRIAGSRSGRLPQHVTVLERELVSAAKADDRAARDAVVDIFQPFVAGVARAYRGSPSVCRTELMQEGVVGLLTAVDRYDESLGTPFWAYACWWVRQAMQRLVAELGRPVVLSDRALRQLARVKDAGSECLRERGHEPTLLELAVDTGFSKEQIESLLAVDRQPRPLESARQGGGASDPLVEMLPDPRAEDAYDRVLPALEAEKLRRLGANLAERERTVLRGRFGLGGRELTLREIGARLDLSAERVRQIEERALDKLRAGVR
jgi:RNA polymerase primary sigma factor